MNDLAADITLVAETAHSAWADVTWRHDGAATNATSINSSTRGAMEDRRTDAPRPMSAPAFRVEPASADHFDDVSIMLAPTRPGTTACWCLSHRIDPAVNRELGPDARPGYMRRLCRQPVAPGVLAHDVDEVVGWAGVVPRAGVYSIARNSRIPKLDDDLAIWPIWCLKVRAGHRSRGAKALIDGAARFARGHGAAAVEGYPVDNTGKKIDTMLAFVGTRSLSESAGFVTIADTGSRAAGVPRIVLRLAD